MEHVEHADGEAAEADAVCDEVQCKAGETEAEEHVHLGIFLGDSLARASTSSASLASIVDSLLAMASISGRTS